MSTAALSTGEPAVTPARPAQPTDPRRSSQPPTPTRPAGPTTTAASEPQARRRPRPTTETAPTAAAEPQTPRQARIAGSSTEAPTVETRAPRRARIAGSSTEPLSVRGCAGDDLGRHLHVVRAFDSGRAADRPARFRHELEAPALRLTRRGRLLVMALSILIFGSAVAVLGLRIAGVLDPGPHFTETISVQVTPGETLWSIAQHTNPGHDPAAVVERIADANNLPNAAVLTPGQTLQVPIAR